MSLFDVFDGDRAKGSGLQFIIARVKKVVLGQYYSNTEINYDYESEKDLGKIYYEPLYIGKSNVSGKNISKPAYPIFPFIRQYPNLNEIVMIITGPSSKLNDGIDRQDSWYFPPFGIWNSVHSNPFPNLQEWAAYCQDKLSQPDFDFKSSQFLKMPQGKTFLEKIDIKTLRPFEGDTILQGRWGQSIRLGSTVPELKSFNRWSNSGPSGDPITMIVNSQKTFDFLESQAPTTIEDINRDGSSIYLTSTQVITVEDVKKYKIRSYTFEGSFDPITSTVIKPERAPISNEFISPQDQDLRSIT